MFTQCQCHCLQCDAECVCHVCCGYCEHVHMCVCVSKSVCVRVCKSVCVCVYCACE